MNSGLIAITLPHKGIGEEEAIKSLIDNGIDYVHIRKPGWKLDEVEELLKKVPDECYSQISIHYQHSLAEKYNLGGVHESKGNNLKGATEKRKSKSCHSIRELIENCKEYDYLFLSPIFDSISKKGYNAGIDHGELLRILKHPCCDTMKAVALGGLSSSTISNAKKLGFKSVALLGGLWALKDQNHVDNAKTLRYLDEIKQLWTN